MTSIPFIRFPSTPHFTGQSNSQRRASVDLPLRCRNLSGNRCRNRCTGPGDRTAQGTTARYPRHVGGCLVILGILFATWMPPAAHAEVTAEQAREAIRRSVASLRASQNPVTGNWPTFGSFEGGATSLCTLALLNAGVPANDPQIQSALRYLRQLGRPSSTYATSLQTMVYCTAEPKRDWANITRNVKWLEEIQKNEGDGIGGWDYGNMRSRNPDNSNSQFALLALNEAQAIGVPVSLDVWKRAVVYWTTRQKKDGSWSYRKITGKGSMTCAGISSLIIAQQNLTEGDANVLQGRIQCCGPQRDDEAVSKGFTWMERHFSVRQNPSVDNHDHETYLFYYLYGLERIGRLSGRRFIGEHDWYREGAEFLIAEQNLKGEWKGMREAHITTAMGVLFLAKGLRPVVISKLTHTPNDDWNRHRHDVANLTRHLEHRWSLPMTWQVIDHRSAKLEDLLQSPILYLSGRDALRMSEHEKQSLKQYIEQGGFVFAEACCHGHAFDRDFRALMKLLFPDRPLRLLPPDHPVWFADQPISPKFLQPLYGINSCCRTSVVYCPNDLGCLWELASSKGVQYPVDIQEKINATLDIGANVVAYATNRELRGKLDVPIPMTDSSPENEILRGTLRVAKIQHTGGSDDAPAALTNLLRTIEVHLKTRVDSSPILLSPTHPTLPDYPVAFIHGRTQFTWSGEEQDALREFIDHGGLLFGDAICASQEFTQAFRREIERLYPNAAWRRIPPEHPMLSDTFGGFNLNRVQLRKPSQPAANTSPNSQTESVTPLLEGIEIDGRFVVVFSPNDISCALESNAPSDCSGYVRKDAARIGINVLLYALRE